MGAKRLEGAKRPGGKRPGGKRLGGETTRGGNGLGAKRPGFLGPGLILTQRYSFHAFLTSSCMMSHNNSLIIVIVNFAN